MEKDFKFEYYKQKILKKVSSGGFYLKKSHIQIFNYKITKDKSLKKQLCKIGFFDEFKTEDLIRFLKVDSTKERKPVRKKKPKKKRKKSFFSYEGLTPYQIKYKKYLESDKWKRKKARLRAERGNKCEKCGLRRRLETHHLTYDRVFKEKLSDLQILCRRCHREVHSKNNPPQHGIHLELIDGSWVMNRLK